MTSLASNEVSIKIPPSCFKIATNLLEKTKFKLGDQYDFRIFGLELVKHVEVSSLLQELKIDNTHFNECQLLNWINQSKYSDSCVLQACVFMDWVKELQNGINIK